MRRFATMTELSTNLSRQQVLDANDLLDAMDEAEPPAGRPNAK